MNPAEISFAVADALKLPWADKSVDCVISSPPYTNRRTYGQTGIARGLMDWVNDLMVPATEEALRVSRGPVLWVVNGCVKKGQYVPAVEVLIATLYARFATGVIDAALEHPLIWSKNAAPNRRDWWSNQWEYIVPIVPRSWKRYFDWQAIATPQKFKSGGVFRQRAVDGSRRVGKVYTRNALARPYDIIRATVGGGHMGHPLAHHNEAPFPESLVSQILPAICPAGGTVADPFCGSGTVGAVARRLERHAWLSDIRRSQIELSRQRLDLPQPHTPQRKENLIDTPDPTGAQTTPVATPPALPEITPAVQFPAASSGKPFSDLYDEAMAVAKAAGVTYDHPCIQFPYQRGLQEAAAKFGS